MQNHSPIDNANCRILLIDDDRANLLLLERMLNSGGYRNHHSTTDPREALVLLRQNFDLLILDLTMPHMDGFEVMAAIARTPLRLPPQILVLTAVADHSYRIRALENGARDYLTKPFERFELLARVRNLVESHLYQKALLEEKFSLEQRVEERTRELVDTRLQVVRQLGRAAEFRDNETGMHIIRMSQMAAAIGQASGLSEDACNMLLHASPMHDIGKIGIPDHILLKPGKLDPEEWRIMQTHTTIGADILATGDSELMRAAREIALCHHERWDGEGYPQGLKGEDIPLLSRVTAIADVYDALTSDRPYKKAWSVEKAVELIQQGAGSQFDPQLTLCLEELVPIFSTIRSVNPDPPAPHPLHHLSQAMA
ncbi:MAG: response regulator [Gammaproteobacteria bacterium]|nr:response regulator [Gammaproteobacteria bacterium]